jgi:hypothetical protein
VVIDDALRIAGGAGRVIEADRVPFVGWRPPGEVGIAAFDEPLVVDRAQRRPAGLGEIVVDVAFLPKQVIGLRPTSFD